MQIWKKQVTPWRKKCVNQRGEKRKQQKLEANCITEVKASFSYALFTESITVQITLYLKEYQYNIMIALNLSTSLVDDDMPQLHLFTKEIIFCYPTA